MALSLCLSASAQSTIDVMESTIKVGALSEEVFYFGFAEGDQLIFSFQEVNKKELKELEITEWPVSSRFAEFKINKIENKKIEVPRTAIYKFRLSNTAITGRICRVHIQRIPASVSTATFNTNVYWRVLNDTTYTPAIEKYLVRIDTTITPVVDQVAKVSSQNAINGNSNVVLVDVDLPEGTTAWSYYIGVGDEGKQAFEEATETFTANAAKQVVGIPGYGVMAALAISGINFFVKVQGRNNVKYWIIPDWNNAQLFQLKQGFQAYKLGDVINDASRMSYPVEGKVFFGLMNDNLVEPIEVVVKVTAVKVVEYWSERTVNKMAVTQRTEPFLKF